MITLQQLTNVQAREAAERLSRDAIPAAAVTGAVQEVRTAVKAPASPNGTKGDNVKLSSRASGYTELKSGTAALAKIEEKIGLLAKLAQKSSSDTVDERERRSLQEEFDAIRKEMKEIEQRTLVGDRPLLDGSAQGSMAVRAGLGRAARLGETVAADLPDARTTSLGKKGARVSDLDISTQEGAAQAFEVLTEAQELIGSHRTRLDKILSRVETAMQSPGLSSSKEAQLRRDAANKVGQSMRALEQDSYRSLGSTRDAMAHATQAFGLVARETEPVANKVGDSKTANDPGTHLLITA